ncbi:uncharacterized protein J3R85_011205 [Psidium guajava]|nr:uncharacterized protein J3R85_011205 [Psidium guajava]
MLKKETAQQRILRGYPRRFDFETITRYILFFPLFSELVPGPVWQPNTAN